MNDARCEEFRELVSAYVDDALGGPELLGLEAHLSGCAACRAFEAGMRRFSGLLQAAEVFRPLRQPPPGFAALVAARAVGQETSAAVRFPASRAVSRASRVPWMGMVAAAALAALFFTWSWQRLLPGDATPPQRVARAVAPAGPAAPPAGTVLAAADEGSMDSWMREHAMLARGNTLLGQAEEIEFASFRDVAAAER